MHMSIFLRCDLLYCIQWSPFFSQCGDKFRVLITITSHKNPRASIIQPITCFNVLSKLVYVHRCQFLITQGLSHYSHNSCICWIWPIELWDNYEHRLNSCICWNWPIEKTKTKNLQFWRTGFPIPFYTWNWNNSNYFWECWKFQK
jgi:hypothetical protein